MREEYKLKKQKIIKIFTEFNHVPGNEGAVTELVKFVLKQWPWKIMPLLQRNNYEIAKLIFGTSIVVEDCGVEQMVWGRRLSEMYQFPWYKRKAYLDNYWKSIPWNGNQKSC